MTEKYWKIFYLPLRKDKYYIKYIYSCKNLQHGNGKRVNDKSVKNFTTQKKTYFYKPKRNGTSSLYNCVQLHVAEAKEEQRRISAKFIVGREHEEVCTAGG